MAVYRNTYIGRDEKTDTIGVDMDDKPVSSFINMAHANIDANLKGPIKAFFWLALEAIRQLTRIAEANEKIFTRLDGWDNGGALDVVTHKLGEF